MDDSSQRELASLLVSLRRQGQQQSGLHPRLVPPDRQTAYRIARMVEEELACGVAGWKIAAFKADLQKQLRTDAPIYGRVFSPYVMTSPASIPFAKLCSPIPEVEYQVCLGADLPPRPKAYTLDEVAEAVASLHPGIELAECRFAHDAAFPPLTAVLADGAGAGRIVYGQAIENWRTSNIAGQEVTLYCNDRPRRKGTAREVIDHPLAPLTWLANELSCTGIGLKAGQMISTGTLTGMLRPKMGETYIADYGPFGKVEAKYI